MNNDFNREFIFSVAQDKHAATHWLFGGIWEVLERRPEQQADSYTVALREDLMGPFTRRLWIRHKRSGRNSRQRMESVLPAMTVSSILEEPFANDPFPRGTIGSITASPIFRLSSARLGPTGGSHWRA